MQSNNALHKATTKRDRVLHKKVRLLALEARDYLAKNYSKSKLSFECHSIARAISIIIPELKMVNGVYLGLEWSKKKTGPKCRIRTCRHSWLVTPDGAILDPYPVGFITIDVPLVVTKGLYKMFGGAFYQKNEGVTSEISWKEVEEKSLILVKMIREAEKKHTLGK